MGAKPEELATKVTTLTLKALTAKDDGKSIKFGQSMTGTVRASKDGVVAVHVSWRYRVGGKVRELRIGTWRDKDGLSLKALRDERDRLATELRSGVDPIARKATERLQSEAALVEEARRQTERIEAAKAAEAAQAQRVTVRQVFVQWRTADLQPRIRADGKRVGRKDGGQYVSDQFGRHVFPAIGEMAIEEVRKANLLPLLDAKKAAGQMRTANVLLAALKQMLDFAAERELIAVNPLATVKKSKIGGAEVARDRALTDDEIRMLVPAIASANLSVRSATAIWLTLATGVRVGELLGAVWNDTLPTDPLARMKHLDTLREMAEADDVKLGIVDANARTWYLPTTKNQRDHTIHLSQFALLQFSKLAALREVLVEADGRALSPWVFPATDNRRPVCVKSFGKQLSDRQREPELRMRNRTKATTSLTMSGGKWTAHDLRRTAATVMARLGVSSDTINECLNHVQADKMARVYIQDRREADQIKAFDALGGALTTLAYGLPVTRA